MTKDEALDLALETLRSAAGELYRVTSYCDTYDALAKTNNAIIDIQQARSAPVQKRPQNCGTGYCSCVECVMEPAPVQEPIGYLFQHEENGLTMVFDVQQVEWGFKKNNPRHQKIGPVYTTPPAAQRQWVGLTDEEIEKACVPLGAAMLSFTEVARAIEAKLRSKNNG